MPELLTLLSAQSTRGPKVEKYKYSSFDRARDADSNHTIFEKSGPGSILGLHRGSMGGPVVEFWVRVVSGQVQCADHAREIRT